MDKITEKSASKINGFVALFVVIGLFVLDVYLLSQKFPHSEIYGITSQFRRAAVSIAANIAEGHGRFHYQDETQFVRQARGSLSETLDHLICALDEEYITDEQYNGLRIQYEVCIKLMNGNIAYLQKKINE